MSIMRKKIAILLAFSLLGSIALTACSSTQTSTDTREETVTESTNDAVKPEDYPNDAIEVVYHSSAGGGGDFFIRTFGKSVERTLGQSWVVNNVTGAAGANAWNYVSKADPDGYTLLGVSTTIISNPIANNMPISYKDFDPIAALFIDPVIYYVPTDSPYQTIQDLIDDANSNPGEIKVSGGTAGGTYSVAHQEFLNATGVDMPIVPYEGGADQLAAVLGGHLPVGIGNYADIIPNLEAGTIRVLVTFNKMDIAPEIPDFSEAGYPEIKFEAIRGFMAPKGTDPGILNYLAEVFETSYDEPEFKEYMELNALIPSYKPGAEMIEVMDALAAQTQAALDAAAQ